MTAPIEKLGKLSLAILEHYVEDKLGKEFVDELRVPTDRTLALAIALERTQDRLLEFEDKTFPKIILSEVSQSSVPFLSETVGKFYDNPTDLGFPEALRTSILTEFPNLPKDEVDRGVAKYISILTAELALVDERFRENVSVLANLRGQSSHRELANMLRDLEERLRRERSELSANLLRLERRSKLTMSLSIAVTSLVIGILVNLLSSFLTSWVEFVNATLVTVLGIIATISTLFIVLQTENSSPENKHKTDGGEQK